MKNAKKEVGKRTEHCGITNNSFWIKSLASYHSCRRLDRSETVDKNTEGGLEYA